MFRTSLLCLLLLWPLWLAAAPVAPSREMPQGDGPWVVRAWFPDKAALNRVASRNAPWQLAPEEGWVMLELANRFEYQRLLNEGFKIAIDPELSRVLVEPAALRSIPGFACYRTVEETADRLAQLVNDHPTLARLEVIGESWERSQDPGQGYALQVLVLGNQAKPGPKPIMFIMGAVHAREYTTAELTLRFGEQLLADYDSDADVRWLLDTHEVHLLPQSNPDGRKQAEAGLSWRKNVNEAYCGATSNSRGADLNRNFPYEWGAHGGSSGNPCDSTYRGLAPSSEPETNAIIDYVRTIFPDRRPDDLVSPAPDDTQGMFLDIHSFSELVIWAWGFTEDPAPNGTALATLGRRLAWFNGYTPQQAVDLYVTDGTTVDFTYGELGVPAFTFELGTSFFQSCDVFENEILPSNLAALRYALRVSSLPYQWPAGPELVGLTASPVEPGESALFLGVADDRRFEQGNGAESSQRVIGGRIRSGTVDGPVVALLSALDGQFDSEREELLGSVDSSGLAVGRHLLLAQAEDESTASGPPAAQWLEVVAPGTTGRVQGRLLNAADGLPISGGVVRSEDYASLHGPGGYSLRLLPGSQNLRGEAAGFLPSATQPVTVQAGKDQVLDFALLPECTLLSSDAESGEPEGWTFTFPWGLTQNQAFSPSHAFADSPSGDYSNGSNTALLLPEQDLSEISSPRLRFASWCDTESGFDFGRLEYRIGAGSWNEAWRCSGQPGWQNIEVDLAELGGQAAVQLRFRLTSDGFVTRDGWYLDDIALIGGTTQCPSAKPWESFADGFE